MYEGTLQMQNNLNYFKWDWGTEVGGCRYTVGDLVPTSPSNKIVIWILGLVDSDKNISEVFSYMTMLNKPCPYGGARYDLRAMVCKILVEVYYVILQS